MEKLPVLLPFLLFLTGTAPFHGLNVEVEEGAPSIIATCTYSGGIPVKCAEVTIFSPAEDETAFQNGHTDQRGIFAFVPDEDGTWKMIVDDGMGHREEVEIVITRSFFRPAGTDTVQVSGNDTEFTDGENSPALFKWTILILIGVIALGFILFLRVRGV